MLEPLFLCTSFDTQHYTQHMNEQTALIKKIKQACASGPGEHFVNILKAGLATAPFCGGIASLMTDYIPSSKFQRLEKFSHQIANDLNQLQDKVDIARIQTDEFTFLFENCFKGVAENYQEEKINAFRGILTNSAIEHDLSQNEKEYFLNLVNSLSVLHIRILKFMANPKDYLNQNNIPLENIKSDIGDTFSLAFPGIDLEVIKSALEGLFQYGLIKINKGSFNVMTYDQGFKLILNRVTDLGTNFINFCTSPID